MQLEGAAVWWPCRSKVLPSGGRVARSGGGLVAVWLGALLPFGGRVARSGGGLVAALLKVAVVWWPCGSELYCRLVAVSLEGGGLVAVLLEGAAVWWPRGSKCRWFGGRVAQSVGGLVAVWQNAIKLGVLHRRYARSCCKNAIKIKATCGGSWSVKGFRGCILIAKVYICSKTKSIYYDCCNTTQLY